MGRPKEDLKFRFWSKVDKGKGCWLWKAGRLQNGLHYGRFWYGVKTTYAHRVSYLLSFGEIPTGMCVLHRCDNPICVNPKHLFLGTKLDNKTDSVNKKRHAFGIKNGNSKLTELSVKTIRKLYKGHGYSTKLGKKFGVSHTMISNIVNKKSWKHLV